MAESEPLTDRGGQEQEQGDYHVVDMTHSDANPLADSSKVDDGNDESRLNQGGDDLSDPNNSTDDDDRVEDEYGTVVTSVADDDTSEQVPADKSSTAYFGDTGRDLFHQRYQWLSRQRNVALTSPTEKVQVTYFAEKHDKGDKHVLATKSAFSLPKGRRTGRAGSPTADGHRGSMTAEKSATASSNSVNTVNTANSVNTANTVKKRASKGGKKGSLAGSSTTPPLSPVLLHNSLTSLATARGRDQSHLHEHHDYDSGKHGHGHSHGHGHGQGQGSQFGLGQLAFSPQKSLTGFVGFAARDARLSPSATPLTSHSKSGTGTGAATASPAGRLSEPIMGPNGLRRPSQEPLPNSLGTAATLIGPFGAVGPVVLGARGGEEQAGVTRGTYGPLRWVGGWWMMLWWLVAGVVVVGCGGVSTDMIVVVICVCFLV